MIINGIEIHELRSNVVDGYSPSGATIIDAIDNLLRFKAENEQLRTQRWSYKEANGILNQQVEELRQQLADEKERFNTRTIDFNNAYNANAAYAAKVRDLEQQLAEAQKDAERYRWLRGNGASCFGIGFDATIDAAIAQQKEQSPSSAGATNAND